MNAAPIIFVFEPIRLSVGRYGLHMRPNSVKAFPLDLLQAHARGEINMVRLNHLYPSHRIVELEMLASSSPAYLQEQAIAKTIDRTCQGIHLLDGWHESSLNHRLYTTLMHLSNLSNWSADHNTTHS